MGEVDKRLPNGSCLHAIGLAFCVCYTEFGDFLILEGCKILCAMEIQSGPLTFVHFNEVSSIECPLRKDKHETPTSSENWRLFAHCVQEKKVAPAQFHINSQASTACSYLSIVIMSF